MKRRIFNIVTIILIVFLCLFGVYAPVTKAISYYALFGGYVAALAKLIFEYICAVKKENYFSGEIFTAAAGTLLFFTGHTAVAAAVMVIYIIGNEVVQFLGEREAVSLAEIKKALPEIAFVMKEGNEVEIPSAEVETGNIVIVHQGEKIPADGVVFRGSSIIDGKAFCRDEVIEVSEGREVLAGYINQGETIQVEVTSPLDKSLLAQAINDVEKGAEEKLVLDRKLGTVQKAMSFLGVIAAACIAVIPFIGWGIEISETATYVAAALMIASINKLTEISKCATGIYLYEKLKKGIAIVGKSNLETLKKVETVILEKNTKIAEGHYEVVSIVESEDASKEEILTFAAHMEYFSKHSIGKAIVRAYKELARYEGLNEETAIKFAAVSHFEEIPNKGVTGRLGGRFICVGSDRLMGLLNISELPESEEYTVVHVAVEQQYVGSLMLRYVPKDGMEDVYTVWNNSGIKNYAVLNNNLEEIIEGLQEFQGEDAKTAFMGTECDETVEEKTDLSVMVDVLRNKQWCHCGNIFVAEDDLTAISHLKEEFAGMEKSLIYKNIALVAAKVLVYVLAAAMNISLIVPAAIDCILTAAVAKISYKK